MIPIESVKKTFERAGYSLRRTTHYITEFYSSSVDQYIYLENTVGLDNSRNHYIRIVLHPQSDVSMLRRLDGVTIPPQGLTHNSNLAEFPKRMHTGDTAIHYGIPINVDSVRELEGFLKSIGRATATGIPNQAL